MTRATVCTLCSVDLGAMCSSMSHRGGLRMHEFNNDIDFCILLVTRPSDGRGVPLACSLDGERVWAVSNMDLDRHRRFRAGLSSAGFKCWQDRVKAASPKIFDKVFALEAEPDQGEGVVIVGRLRDEIAKIAEGMKITEWDAGGNPVEWEPAPTTR